MGAEQRVRCRIVEVFRRLEWLGWWGDHLDSRFELAAMLTRLPACRVLDVACGPGAILSQADSSSLRVGTDLALDRLRAAQSVCPDAHWVCADVGRLPFRPGSFDTIVLAGVPQAIPDMRRFMVDVARLGIPGAKVLATVHNRDYWLHRDGVHLPRLEDVKQRYSIFRWFRISGYNPMPSIVFMLPMFVKRRIPRRIAVHLYLPGRFVAAIPGALWMLRRLMRCDRLRRASRSFIIRAEV